MKEIKIVRKYWSDDKYGCFLGSNGRIIMKHNACNAAMFEVDFTETYKVYKCDTCGHIYRLSMPKVTSGLGAFL